MFSADIGVWIPRGYCGVPGLGGEMDDHVGTKPGVDVTSSVLEYQFLGGEMRRPQQDGVTVPLERDVAVRRYAWPMPTTSWPASIWPLGDAVDKPHV